MILPFWTLGPLLLASVPQTLFVICYALPLFGAGQWWSEPVGRALCIKSATFALVLDLVTLRVFFNVGVAGVSFAAPSGAWDIAGAIGYWLVLVGVCYQLAVLVRQRHHERRKP